MTIQSPTSDRLPLLFQTPDAWADFVLQDTMALLSDHAYLERKAASNAFDLLNRWPAPKYPTQWVTTLSAVARDEAAHLYQVTRLIAARGGKLQRLHRNPYAADLRRLIRAGKAQLEVADLLMTSSLIEARSCERFGVLGRRAQDAELVSLYRGLWSSEFGHHKVFLDLAAEILSADELQTRWQELLEAEAQIIQNQPLAPGILSGPVHFPK